MLEKLSSSRTRKGVATAMAALTLAGAVSCSGGGRTEKPAPQTSVQNTDPYGVARAAIAHRYDGCKLVLENPAAGPADITTGVSFTMTLDMTKKAQPYFNEYIADGAPVSWDDAAIVTRTVPKTLPKDRYYPVASMQKNVTGNKDGLLVAGTLFPHSARKVGAYVDVWKDETTSTGNGITDLNAIYCGRIVRTEVDGDLGWQVDAAQTAPLEPLFTGVVEGGSPNYDRELNPSAVPGVHLIK